jgi:hypothetical protein
MNDAEIFKALAPARWTLLGLKLRPFALGHLVLLHRIESPFVTGDGLPDLHALFSAVFICSRTYEEADTGIEDPTLPRAFRRWRRKLMGWFGQRPINLVEKWQQFQQYMREGQWTPTFQRAENTRTVGIPIEQSVRVKLQRELGLSDSEILNRPWALCMADFYTLLDSDSIITIWGDSQLAELKRLREQAEDVEQRLKAGKIEVR